MRRWVAWIMVSLACGVPLGYSFFYAVLPNVSFPVTERAPIYVQALLAFGLGLAIGLIVDGMEGVIVTTIGALAVGGVIASGLVISPLLAPEIDSAFAGDLVLSVLRMALPYIIASMICLVAGGFFGQYLNDDNTPDKEIFSGEVRK